MNFTDNHRTDSLILFYVDITAAIRVGLLTDVISVVWE